MASTYTLNNGIELIGTGEQSGTWGDTTNTNLELLDTALDGQVTITASSAGNSGSPNSLPITDGSASNGRNRLINITSGSDLGATVFYQLTPNDAEKIVYIRNSLNAQDLIVFQGTYNSSNDYLIPNGTTAVVFFNGAGSGAVAANVFNNAHFDAMNVVGGVTITTDDNNPQLTLVSTDADANAGPILKLRRNSASPADNDLIGAIDWTSENSGGDEHDFLNLTARMRDVTAGNEDVSYAWTAYLAGTGREIQSFVNTDASAASMVFNEDSQDIDFRIETNGEENAFFVDGGNDAVVIGESAAHTTISGGTPAFQVSGEGFRGGAAIVRNDNGIYGPFLALTKSRNSTPGSFTIVQDNDTVGTISWFADDGTNLDSSPAVIDAQIDGTPGANDVPGRLVFRTAADGAASATERLRIDSEGLSTFSYPVKMTATQGLGIGAATPAAFGSGVATIVFQGMQDNGRAGAINFREYAASGDGDITAQIYSTDGDDGYGFVLNAQQGSLKLNVGGLSETVLVADTSKRVIIGSNSVPTKWWNGTTYGSLFGVENNNRTTATNYITGGFIRNSNDSEGPQIGLGKSRGTATSSANIVSNGDTIGLITGQAADGTNFVEATRIAAQVGGTPGDNDMPGKLVFSTTSDGNATPTARMSINARGDVFTAQNSTLSSYQMNMYGSTITIPGNSTRYVTFHGNQLSGGSGVAEVTIGFYGSAGTGTGGLKVIDAGHWGGTVYHQATEIYRFSGNLTVNAITETSGGWKAEVVNGVAQSATGFYMIHANVGTDSQDMTDIVTVETS